MPLNTVQPHHLSVDRNQVSDRKKARSLGSIPCWPVIPATPSVPTVVVVQVLSPSSADNLRRVALTATNRSSSARTDTGWRRARSLSRSQSAATAAYWHPL